MEARHATLNGEFTLETLRGLWLEGGGEEGGAACEGGSQATVLEVGSGTGQHALLSETRGSPWLAEWWPTEIAEDMLHSIVQHLTTVEGLIMREPMVLDLANVRDFLDSPWAQERSKSGGVSMIVCVNVLHIAPRSALQGLFELAKGLLGQSGFVYVHGPLRVSLPPSSATDSQVDFDETFDGALRAVNPEWGVRTLVELSNEADTQGFQLYSNTQAPQFEKYTSYVTIFRPVP